MEKQKLEEIFQGLINHYGLTEEDCNKQVSGVHLEKISRSCCENWFRLTVHLGLEIGVAKSIKRSQTDEEQKGYDLLLRWEDEKGHDATYSQLIKALLTINSKQDAEKVCTELCKDSCPTVVQQETPSACPKAASTTGIHAAA